MTDDKVAAAAHELNRRIARSHRRVITATTVVAVVAGLAAISRTVTLGEPEGTGIYTAPAIFVLVAIATFALGDALLRSAVKRVEASWTPKIAARFGVNPKELEGLALPLGGLEPRPAGRSKLYRTIARAVIVFASLLALQFAAPQSIASNLACVALGILVVLALKRYLSGGPPP